MADTRGFDYVRNNWTAVKDKMADSLTLNSYTDTATVRPNGDVELNFPITTPSLRLIELEESLHPSVGGSQLKNDRASHL